MAADEKEPKKDKPQGEEAAPEAPSKPKKGLPKTPILIAVITVVQAGAFYGATQMFGGGPQVAHGSEHETEYLHGEEPVHGPATVEVSLIEKFKVPNSRSGRMYIYDFDVSIKIPGHRQEETAALVAGRKSEISDRIARIVRAADPTVLSEPELKTLREQFRQVLGEIFGDADLVLEVFLPRCVPIRTD